MVGWVVHQIRRNRIFSVHKLTDEMRFGGWGDRLRFSKKNRRKISPYGVLVLGGGGRVQGRTHVGTYYRYDYPCAFDRVRVCVWRGEGYVLRQGSEKR